MIFYLFLFIGLFFKINNQDIVTLPFENLDALINFVKPFLPENPTIVEAGAYDGNETLKMQKAWPSSKIFSFEPIPELYRILIQKTKEFKNINCFNLALSDKCGISKFYVSEFPEKPGFPSASSSLLPPKEHLNYSGVLFRKQINVFTTTLENWMTLNKLQKIDFLWLDMQGYELHMLKASTEALKKVSVIITEVEFIEAYAGQYLYQDIKCWLESQNFVMVAKNFQSPPEYWFGDAIFVKKDLIN